MAGNAMNGMANVIAPKGSNLSNSAAAINLTQARKNEIQNRQQWTNTYFDMRNTQRQQMAARREQGPRRSNSRESPNGTPDPLAPNQMDPVTGRLYWPGPAARQFCTQRQVVDQAFVLLSRYGGSTTPIKCRRVRRSRTCSIN